MLKTEISSPSGKVVTIGPGLPTVIIGERINPTGKKLFAEKLIRGDLTIIQEEALRQVAAGADILDVNVGAARVDEPKLLAEAVQLISRVVDVPLCIDSSKPEALEAALQVYRGKALINSVTGEEQSLSRMLPLVKEYRAAVIGLCMDENGIPAGAAERLRIARKILERAEKEGISAADVIIDCLAMTVASDQGAALTTLEAMRMVKKELGVNLTLGASNVSFGLPDRRTINMAFFALAIEAGLTCAILDPTSPGIRRLVRATDLLLGYDEWALRYIDDTRRYPEQ
ncbi:MAG: dihydropteroate synthase [Thermoanaerobacteraceae bacterium]|nr:dihydropteroate synthase [Thermoanaerobacteraceae bacterium]